MARFSNSLHPIAAASAIVALFLAACGQQEQTPPPAAAPAAAPAAITVKLGHAAPLTGGIAHLGKDNESGVSLAVDEANSKGITIGGKPVKFELMSEDDEGNPNKGPLIAQKFADAKVAGVIGHLNSGVAIPASSVYNTAGIPVITGSATNPKLTEQGFAVTFRTVGRDDQQGPAIASYLLSETKPKLVAIIDDATAYGAGLANEVENSLKAAGVKVLPREKGTDKTIDWKGVLTKIKGKSPDAVFYGGMDSGAGPLMKQARELGIKARFAFGDGACSDKMQELAGAAAEGLLCSQAGIPVQASGAAFLDAYRKKFNADPVIYAPFTYDAANMIIAAMKKADSTDPAVFLPALKALQYDGASGHIEFDEKGDRKDAEMTIFTMKAGKIEPVAVIKGGKTIPIAEFAAAAKPAEAPAAAAAPAAEAPKAEEKK
jgi:branched-chain amino acid transport system substrate-binding protein